MQLIELKATIRNSKGNGPAKRLRKENKIPAILYGKGIDSIPLTVDSKDMENILKTSKSGQVIINLSIQNGTVANKNVMIKLIQTHPVTRNFLHIDFYEIDMSNKIKVKIPIVITGESKGVGLGGVIQIIKREIEVMCLPTEIPHSITLDVTELGIGDSIHIKDIPVQKGVEISAPSNFAIVTVVSTKAEKTETTGPTAEEGQTEETKPAKDKKEKD
ncbi:MAG: 50S ribosomal protein L25/general stress protein Ctc [Desulfobacterales bacterium]|nr:50S ribosomal protein L25/general stress protein Ctc [Desulfobacterales bacterium]